MTTSKGREQLYKLLDYRISKILEIDKENFDPTYIEEIAELLENDKELSPDQITAVNNIYEAWVH